MVDSHSPLPAEFFFLPTDYCIILQSKKIVSTEPLLGVEFVPRFCLGLGGRPECPSLS
jgi:hypothetical protein